METPEFLMQKIRQRIGLKEDDKSHDAEIESWAPMTRLRKVVGWTLGDAEWADTIIEWAKLCGMKIEE